MMTVMKVLLEAEGTFKQNFLIYFCDNNMSIHESNIKLSILL